jgi:hypothetical protein
LKAKIFHEEIVFTKIGSVQKQACYSGHDGIAWSLSKLFSVRRGTYTENK